LAGVTGTKLVRDPAVIQRLAEVRAGVTSPLMVGFGIKTGEDAACMARHADGVVIGSALVEAIAAAPAGQTAASAGAFIRGVVSRLRPG
jgi:tryptophan synthase alpha chain